MPQPAQLPEGPRTKASDKIPPLTTIAPSILVPLQEDSIQNFEPPRDRIERLKQILKTIDYHREGVKENLFYMFEREKQRIILRAAEIEQMQGAPKYRPGLAADDVDDIIANMEAPAQTDMDYNIRNMPELDIQATMSLLPNATIRDRTVMELLVMVERGLQDLQQFEKYMAGIKEQYLTRLGQEVARIEDAGKRPEERRGSRGH